MGWNVQANNAKESLVRRIGRGKRGKSLVSSQTETWNGWIEKSPKVHVHYGSEEAKGPWLEMAAISSLWCRMDVESEIMDRDESFLGKQRRVGGNQCYSIREEIQEV